MRPAVGVRDTLVTFQTRAQVQDPVYGTWSDGDWGDLVNDPTEWAEVRDMLPSRAENVGDNINLARRPCRVRCLYREDITTAMRLKIDGREGVWGIVSGPAELGRRDGIEIVCEQLSTEGEAP